METGTPIPEVPVLFNKYNNALSGHSSPVALPKGGASPFDYEAELIIVVGREAKDVDEADALDFLADYACGEDLTARDLRKRTSQFMLGKSLDGFGALGPYLVTVDEVSHPDG